ncbi:MAG TPA: 4Fe-4S binding protein [Candidatus Aminicenantes bacterium]|nr:4Fe-4S binding protein [Candidatus Aminicenantes bacterium]
MPRTLICSHSRPASIFLTTVLFFMMAFLLVGGNRNHPGMMAASLAYLAFMTVLAYLLFRSGRVHRYRSIFFSVYAIAFVLNFIPMLLETRGHIALTGRDIANLDTPLCHLTIPMLILPGLVYGVLIFPTKLFADMGFYPMLFLWLGATVVLGKGWCSWGCFYGGLDEFFSKLLPKRIVSSRKFNYALRWFPFALLLVIVIWSFLALDPVYCGWLCPFKAVTEFVQPTNWLIWVQTGIFLALFLGLVVVLPLLMKRRTQCGLFCPFGAFQSFVGLANPYRVRIDKEKCNQCGACVDQCPTFAITRETLAKNKVSITCARCGRCMEICPRDAIQFSLLGVPLRGQDAGRAGFLREVFRPDSLFTFGALLFGAVISGGMVAQVMLRFVHLARAGSFLFR